MGHPRCGLDLCMGHPPSHSIIRQMKETLKSFGMIATGIILLIVFVVLVGLVIEGAGWLSDRLLPWFAKATGFANALLFLVLLPMSIFKRLRTFTSGTIFMMSYLFGITLWMTGLLVTLENWGSTGVLIGLFLGGVGVVPIGMLASLLHREWLELGMLIGLTVLTFGSRFFALWLEGTIRSKDQYEGMTA